MELASGGNGCRRGSLSFEVIFRGENIVPGTFLFSFSFVFLFFPRGRCFSLSISLTACERARSIGRVALCDLYQKFT